MSASTNASASDGSASKRMATPSRFQLYKELAKSGIVTLVLISVLGGYLAGAPLEQPISIVRLLWTLAGILALASGSSALNQIQDRDIDAAMPRTVKRPLPSGKMSLTEAWTFVSITVLAGLAILWSLAPSLFILGLLALVSYNGLYTLWWKRHWAFAAIPGAVPGALPILMGYAAASGSVFSLGGLYLFFILFFWQMPHFWVLAIRYTEDYSLGGVPTLPVKLGKPVTVSQITIWCLGYVGLATLAPPFLGVSGLYCIGAMAVSLKILWELRAFRKSPESKHWLRFFLWVNFSLILYIALAVLDRWNYHLLKNWWVR